MPARAFIRMNPAVVEAGVPVVERAAEPDVATPPFGAAIDPLCWRHPVTFTSSA